MKLYVPREMQCPLDLKDDEFCPSLKEWADLQEILEDYKDFNEVMRALAKNKKHTNVDLRYPALSLKEIPAGSVGDWLTSILNIFGDYALCHGGRIPASMPKDYLMVKMCEELDISERVAKTRLLTLFHGKYLQEQYGNVLFPVKMLRKQDG